MSRTSLGRADLVKVIGAADEHVVQFVAARLGLAERVAISDLVKPTAPPRKSDRAPGVVDAKWPDEQAAVAFWRPVSFQVRDSDAYGNRQSRDQPEPMYDDWRQRPDEVPLIQPLATWSQLVPRLRRGLTRGSRGSRVDMPGLVRLVARRRLVRKLPRRTVRRWGSSVLLVLDFSDRMIPFRQDQELVCGCLQRLLPAHALQIATCSDPANGVTLWKDGTSYTLVSPDSNSVVLVLGDLGTLDQRGPDVERSWLRWGCLARSGGSQLIALVPCPESLVSDPLRRVFSVHPWQRSTVDDNSPQLRKRRADALMRVASAAIRLEPGLLRDLRSVNPDWSDASLESLVWQHNAMRSRHPSAATLDPEASIELLSQFERLDDCLKTVVLDLIRRWHAAPDLEHSVWFDEVRRLSSRTRRLIPIEDEQDALAQARSLRDRAEKGALLDGPILDFCYRTVDRQSNAGWNDPMIGPIYRQLSKITHPEVDPTSRPGADPAEEPPGDTIDLVEIRQQGDRLRFCIVPTAPPVADRGSPCGRVSTTNQLLVLDDTPRLAANPLSFWKGGVAPQWAADWGYDKFGAWAELRIPAADPMGNSLITQRLRWIPPGTFLMGSPDDEPERYDDEGPRHVVTITSGLWLFDTAVTQEVWQLVMGDNPSQFQGARRPVENVSWLDCQRFLAKLVELTGAPFELPTEAQWEYACRAGTTSPFSFGTNISPDLVNYDGNYPYAGGSKGQYRRETVEVASLPASPWGLYEMHGNVREWCRDGMRRYTSDPVQDPLGPTDAGTDRVLRGGGWNCYARFVRSAFRFAYGSGFRDVYLGFRLALVQAEAEPDASRPGLQAERSPGDKQNGEATRTMARLDSAPVYLLRNQNELRILTDLEEIEFERLTMPAWASAIGRDRFGLWVEFAVRPSDSALESITQRMRWIPPGRFQMGSEDPEDSILYSASPAHEVVITHGFWLFDSPVRQALWTAVMESNPSKFKGANRPVERVSWDDCRVFMDRLGGRIAGLSLVLPTEAEWEYACRAVTNTAYAFGDSISPSRARYGVSEEQGTSDVATYSPNDWGLFDMHGNVWEWCMDGVRDYAKGLIRDPVGPLKAGTLRVIRGGGWFSDARIVRSAYRSAYGSGDRDSHLGFRCALVQGGIVRAK